MIYKGNDAFYANAQLHNVRHVHLERVYTYSAREKPAGLPFSTFSFSTANVKSDPLSSFTYQELRKKFRIMSWADVAKKEAQPTAKVQSAEALVEKQKSTAVIDTNAIIAGMSMESIADQLVTIPEVLQEVKDKKTKEYLETFPHNIRTLQPMEDSVRAGADTKIDLRSSNSSRVKRTEGPPVKIHVVWNCRSTSPTVC